MKRVSGFVRDVRQVITSLGNSTPDHLAIPGGRPDQIRVLAASPLFKGIKLEDLTDAQVTLATFVLQLPVTSVAQLDVEHNGHIDAALELVVSFTLTRNATVIVLPCGEAVLSGLRLG